MIIMLVAAGLGSVGQLMLAKSSGVPIKEMLFSWWLWGFVICYGVAVLLQLWSLKHGARLSIIYPVIATSYIWVAILSWKFLGEPISGWSVAGICCIMLGVSLIGWGASV